ncbi:hypothetical protein [Streptomyces sp. NBC_00572]|uniref:hypothetical protein n=1 Tax=Streptomyces sp. NBC_00572 TaxID=2903664 RepID=UPI002256CA1A|nr:hypothetical protein [Streptomyces sp. NBC_00572]MCX4984936.1 hypothetical protein [Streptomyces sp. NBC_00572]
MNSARVWSDGPVGDEAADGVLSRLLGGAGPGVADRRIVTGALVCRYCGADRFEVTAWECFCDGCCLPIGVRDGDVRSETTVWELEPSALPEPSPSPAMVRCPAGHDLFQVAAAYTLGTDGDVRRVSVGLRCPADGALSLFVDDARVVPRTT